MRLVGVREAQSQLSGLVMASQRERIVLTRHGKPVAVLSGVEGMDLEDVLLGQDQAFARHIATRRRSKGSLLTLAQVKTRLKSSKVQPGTGSRRRHPRTT